MAIITQDLRFKQAVIEYSLAHGVTKTAIRYRKTRQWIYYWRRRYNGNIRSLLPLSRRPHSHPMAHTEDEIRLIQNMRKRNPDEGSVMFWIKLLKRQYTRSIASLYRVMRRLGYFNKAAKKKSKYVPKPYEQMSYPGERVQIDCKYVPLKCTVAMTEEKRLFQFHGNRRVLETMLFGSVFGE